MKQLICILMSFNSFGQISVLQTPDASSSDTWKAIKGVFAGKSDNELEIIIFQGKSIFWNRDTINSLNPFSDSVFPKLREINGVSVGSEILHQLALNNKTEKINKLCNELYSTTIEEIIHKGTLDKYELIQDSIIKYANYSRIQSLLLKYSLEQLEFETFIGLIDTSIVNSKNILFVTSNVKYNKYKGDSVFLLVPERIYTTDLLNLTASNKFSKKIKKNEYETIKIQYVPRKIRINKNYYFRSKYFSNTKFIYVSKFNLEW